MLATDHITLSTYVISYNNYVYLVLYVYLVSKSVPDAYAYVAIVAMSTKVYLRITPFVGLCVGGSKIN